jgi:hypothetical protein
MEKLENKTVAELLTIYKNRKSSAQKLIENRDAIKEELKNKH